MYFFKLHDGNIKYYGQKKKGLSSCYSKRIVLEDGITAKSLEIQQILIYNNMNKILINYIIQIN